MPDLLNLFFYVKFIQEESLKRTFTSIADDVDTPNYVGVPISTLIEMIDRHEL